LCCGIASRRNGFVDRMKAPTKAMILAAGLGTRLRPLTDTCPKALVQLNGRTLLEITLARLQRLGIADVIVNVHHCADQLEEYLRQQDFPMHIEISREDELLDTGGGLLKAAHFFLRDRSGDDEPFLLHNVDVISNIDFGAMLELHCRETALATLAVQQRKSSRYLLFDRDLRLCGRRAADRADELVCAAPELNAWAFAGIHVLSPRIFSLMDRDFATEGLRSEAVGASGEATAPSVAPAFSIIPEYLRLTAGGEKILGFAADGSYWRDLGTPASLQQAAEDIQRGVIQL
jgi:NDP-sugar pyrophosphorylase family protein